MKLQGLVLISQQISLLLCFVLAIGILLDVVSFQQCARTDAVVERVRTPTRFQNFCVQVTKEILWCTLCPYILVFLFS
jgi:hypothetical protein